jgi:hypothetical protein
MDVYVIARAFNPLDLVGVEQAKSLSISHCEALCRNGRHSGRQASRQIRQEPFQPIAE